MTRNVRQYGLHWLASAGVILTASIGTPCPAQNQSSASQRLAQRLDARVSLAWQGQQLAVGLERFAKSQRIAVWIDRRVDPATPIEIEVSEQPLRDALAALAAPREWVATPFQGVLYFGPKQTAEELPTLSALARQSIAKAPAEIRLRWLKPEPWSFDRLSEPRTLLNQLAKSVGAQVVDDHLIPHDLWPSRSLPPMSALDRVVLLLSGFDLTCQISSDGRKLRIVPIERPVQITRTYTVGRARRAEVDAAIAEMPRAKVERRGQGGLTLSASLESHERVQAVMRGQSARQASQPVQPPAATEDSKRFTVKIENQPAGRIIDQLARQLQLEVEWDAALRQSPADGQEAIVSCDVRNADLDELLTAVLSPAGLGFERDGEKLKIRRGK